MIEYNENSNGGTELMCRELSSRLPLDLLSKFQIISNNIFHKNYILHENKIKILWIHDAPYQVNNSHLKNGGWKKFHKIIFISYHQMEEYIKEYQIPYSYCTVIKHALEPIKFEEKIKNKISLIYTSTPNRGLDILINVFEKLCEEYSNLELKVYSSFKIYSREKQQKHYERTTLYKRIENHPKIKNIGFVSNEKLKRSLASSHIFSYPSTYQETFCLALLEAMSAGLLCVHSNYACLPETSSNWTMMYDYHEDKFIHEQIFFDHLKKAINIVNNKEIQKKLKYQKKYINYFYNWEKRTQEWIDLLKALENLNSKISRNIQINYS